MKTLLFVAIQTLVLITALSGCADITGEAIPPVLAKGPIPPPGKTMRAFRSEQELTTFLKELAAKQATRQRAAGKAEAATGLYTLAPESSPAGLDKSADESVTNVQHAGVDEGGIVKVHGDHLVVLRRGRLFTVKLGGGNLRPISAVDAFGPEIDPRSTWYDEMLISEDTVVVIGYSYQRGGTEVGLFSIDDRGQLDYRSTYHLRSNDYYSSRNYASRLIGNKLIFYTPLYLNPSAEDPFQYFPAVRKWHKGATNAEFRRITSATNVYRPAQEITSPYGVSLHTVTVCDLSDGGFACNATGVMGPAGRVFYVSPDAVYVWVSDWNRYGNETKQQSSVYRMPLDGSGPSALGVSGTPVDQFSFLESRDQHLNVLVRADAVGEGMWGSEVAAGDVALMRVPIGLFSDGSGSAPPSSYRRLPKPQGYTFQNRFVGDHLLYGTGSGWGAPQKTEQANLFIARWAADSDQNDTEISLPHGVDRIEQLGADAVVIGTDGKDLHFTSIRLDSQPNVAGSYRREGASQGELRSHGFFYKPDGPNSGILGLPISRPGRPGYRHLFESSAAILFLRNDSLRFSEVGELGARPERAVDDGCRASCVDWYGNARPLFVRGRVLALLGYEIVEGFLDDGRIHEMRRTNYAPRSLEVTRR
jgi:Beta propeller domain